VKQKGSVNMATTYTHISDLAREVQPPAKGILSRTLDNDDRLKAVLFGFARGEGLSEHTASMPAVLHFLRGEAKLTPGDDTVEAKPGTWVACFSRTGTARRAQATPSALRMTAVMSS
jgi:quercetin dioxygenase-like cupin family protein